MVYLISIVKGQSPGVESQGLLFNTHQQVAIVD